MGFKSKLNKMKSFLFDEEEEDEKPVKKPMKKIVVKEDTKKISFDEDFSKTQEIENLYLEDLSESETVISPEIKSRSVKNETEFKFPEFDDDDFVVSRTKPEPIIPVDKDEPKPVLYQGSKRKEEIKKFKPSPIISPVYGLLDNDGSKVVKEPEEYEEPIKSKDEISLDEVRRKAYGNYDMDVENTIQRLSTKTIEEAEREMDTKEKELSRTKDKARKMVKEERPIVVSTDDDDDDMILPSVNFKEIDVDKERARDIKKEVKEISADDDDDDDDDDTKEQDLFNLIDTMYQGEDKED